MTDIFKRNGRRNQKGYTISDTTGNPITPGEVGIEIEVEGRNLPKIQSILPATWNYHNDGSLRGEDNAEYVLARPLSFSDVPAAVNDLWDKFKKYETVLDDSNRTSVHVHLNVQTFHMNRLCAFAALYFSVEELLTEFCGENRVGNLFCLRAKDAPNIITCFKRLLREEVGPGSIAENFKYGGLNVYAISKFGSLEVRTMRGVSDADSVIQWVSILQRIYELSKDFTDPRTIMDNFSGYGVMSYLQMVLGEHVGPVLNTVGWSSERVNDSVMEGIRLAQDLCYCRDWSLYEPITMEIDPFGRRKSKTMIMDIESMPSPPLGSGFTNGNALQQYFDHVAAIQVQSPIVYTPPPPAPVSAWATVAVSELEEEDNWEPPYFEEEYNEDDD